jgi:hypothetical protein
MFVDQKVSKFYRLDVSHFDTPYEANFSLRCKRFCTAPPPSFEGSRWWLFGKVIGHDAKKYASRFFWCFD